MGRVPYSLSFYDLLKYPLFRMAAKQDDKELMSKIFYEAGMDTSQEFEIVEVLHRPVTSNTPWLGLRVHGYERLDRKWVECSISSFEAKMYTKDASLRLELLRLDANYNNPSQFEDDYEISIEIPEDYND